MIDSCETVARGFGSVVKHSTAGPGIARSSQEKCSRVQNVSVLYNGHIKEPGLSCVVGAPVSCTLDH